MREAFLRLVFQLKIHCTSDGFRTPGRLFVVENSAISPALRKPVRVDVGFYFRVCFGRASC